MKMMMISSLVETDGWGTPAIPGGGNKGEEVVAKEGVVDVVTRGEDDPIAPASVGDPIKEAGSVALPSHSSESGSGHFRGGGEIYAHSLGENEPFAFLYWRWILLENFLLTPKSGGGKKEVV